MKKIRKLQTADDAESMLEVMDIISAILSPDDEETLYKVFEEEEGMADIERIGVAIAEIMKRSKDAKKSSPSA
ncbi:MAG: hypothetical protein LBS85_02890 [Clostridiales Family XIII bacterium]|nr:hypothetical protein [Clostridiales Family XIII bacterium]